MIRPKLPKTRRSECVDHLYGDSRHAEGGVITDSVELHAIKDVEGTDGLLAANSSRGIVFELPETEQKLDGLLAAKPRGNDVWDFAEAEQTIVASVEPSVIESVVPVHGDEELYSYVEIVWTIISVVSYMVDIGSDIYIAVIYYIDEEWWWFGLTLVFIVVPSLTISAFSFLWYLEDKNLPVMSHPVRFIPRLVLVSLQFGPLIRQVHEYSIKSKFIVDCFGNSHR
jgi:hypothetical protein